MKTKIGIICAVVDELAPFLPHIQNCTQTTKAMLTIHEGQINGVEVAALYCGVGKTNAALATQILIDSFGAGTIINSGTAGGICQNLNIFDTVICTESVHHDVHEGILTGFHPWLASVFFKTCDKLAIAAKQAVAVLELDNTTYYGRMVTGEKFIEDDGRADIISAYAPLSVDMETASIAHVCYVNAVPYIAVRTITDTAKDVGLNSFIVNCPAASEISKNIVLGILDTV